MFINKKRQQTAVSSATKRPGKFQEGSFFFLLLLLMNKDRKSQKWVFSHTIRTFHSKLSANPTGNLEQEWPFRAVPSQGKGTGLLYQHHGMQTAPKAGVGLSPHLMAIPRERH